MNMKSLFNNRKNAIIIFAIVLSSYYPSVKAQKASINLDTSSIKIGEQVQLKISVILPNNSFIYWPKFSDTLTQNIEIISKSQIDSTPTERKDYTNYTQHLLITSFDTGYHHIPPITISYSFKKDASRKLLLSDELFLKVSTIPIDTTLAIKDIKPILKAPVTFAEIAPYLSFVIIIALIIALIWYYFWRKRSNKPIFPILHKPQLPPWEEALNNLQTLKNKHLWQTGKLKEYYTELTDIIRIYLKNQHEIDALEMTTSEILFATRNIQFNKDAIDNLTKILIQSDYVKFAKALPENHENEQCLQLAQQFIINTKPIDIKEENSNTNTTLDIKHD